ncbi:MAG: SusC/RagA family TonB-linked outer membrane protein [Bacteroidota bacterium]
MIFSLQSWKTLFANVAFLLATLCCFTLHAQDTRVVQGIVLNAQNVAVAGATIQVKTTRISTNTGADGRFSLSIPNGKNILVVTYVGMASQEVKIQNQNTISITLSDSTAQLDDIVIVGYGRQKRVSVVAAVSQTTGKVLERAGGVSNIGAALTGNVPGLITNSSTGIPGGEDPQIIIRGRSSWNNADPLILVDGVERPMNSVDISSVETISVLKDASATAVFGSRGANGVILITTKRGQSGKATIRGVINTIVKVPSKLPGKYDSYDALRIRNEAIENELAFRPQSWNDYLPQATLNKYRNPANQEEAERYPNVNWANTLFNDYATANNANVSVSGGTPLVKYFTSVDYLHEGDLFKIYDNKRGYKPGFGYNRLNVRSNLDFQLTPTTLLKVNLTGSYGVQKTPWGFTAGSYGSWIDAYTTAPDVFMPVYSDGTWGWYAPNEGRAENSARSLALGGVQFTTNTRVTTDFTLEQNLNMIAKGLRFNGTVSADNFFNESNRGVNDLFNDAQRKWIDPQTGIAQYKLAFDGNTNFDFQEGIKWAPAGGTVGGNDRRLFYQLQLNYARTFASKHNVSAMGLLNRNIRASGSQVPSFREDWVFRATYNYDSKYSIEYNGAYNGSEKFSPENRYAFFQSGGVNWIVSNEKFMSSMRFVDMFKLRASYGQTGFDGAGPRWLYLSQWNYGGTSRLGLNGEAAEQSAYTWYNQSSIANPSAQWEVAEKINIGTDIELFKGLIKAKVDVFSDKRSKILLEGNRRATPSYFGGALPTVNLGRVNSQGYEIELHVNKMLSKNFRVWADLNMTHTQNEILDADNAALLPDYQKSEGKPIDQAFTYVDQGYYNTWDELYASTMHNENDAHKLPGNYHLVDYNADGIIDAQDQIPYGFSGWPENTYNATLGFDWKGLSVFVQFYAANNVTRQVVFNSLGSQSHTVYDEGSYWSKDNIDGDVPMPRWLSTPAGYSRGAEYMYDGSYVRLKNAEISYSFNNKLIRRLGLTNLRVYINGNNLAAWSKMPDDRESNFAGTGWASQGAYPTFKRYNLGAMFNF